MDCANPNCDNELKKTDDSFCASCEEVIQEAFNEHIKNGPGHTPF